MTEKDKNQVRFFAAIDGSGESDVSDEENAKATGIRFRDDDWVWWKPGAIPVELSYGKAYSEKATMYFTRKELVDIAAAIIQHELEIQERGPRKWREKSSHQTP